VQLLLTRSFGYGLVSALHIDSLGLGMELVAGAKPKYMIARHGG
jgi:hypothetical protein